MNLRPQLCQSCDSRGARAGQTSAVGAAPYHGRVSVGLRSGAVILAATTIVLAATRAAISATRATGDSYAHAAAVVRAQGYVPNRPTEWTPGSTLNALTATAKGSADGYNQRAFFFVRGRFVGVDAPTPSAQLLEIWSAGTTVALLYVLYRNADALCCPTGGGAIVRFEWNGRRLRTIGRVPPIRGSIHR